MKVKSKVIMAMLLLFLVSTIASATSVNTVKSGEAVKVHMNAEGPDLWDSQARVLINAHVEHDYGSSWLGKADFKKIYLDPITNEEVMISHGKLKEGEAFYLEWWWDPNSEQYWQYVWIMVGIGVVKTQTATYPEAEITIIFTLGGNWAWAGYTDGDTGDLGPNNPLGEWGTLTVISTYEEIGADQFDFIKQEQETVLNEWFNGDNIIRPNREYNVAETNYVLMGMIQTDQEKKDKIFNLPWSMTILLDGWEIELSSFWWYDKGGVLIGEPTMVLIFYQIYDPWTLGWGPHTLDHEFSWYNGVGANAWQEIMQLPQWEFLVSWW